MAIQADAMPPSLVAELGELKRRITALERKPKLGSVNERIPYGSFQSPSVEGNAGTAVNTLGVINSTGLNQPVLLCMIPFHIPQSSTAALDVSITLWLRDMVTQAKSAEITITAANDSVYPGATRTITWSWVHPQPIGFANTAEWAGFTVDYRVNKRATYNGQSLTVGVGNPLLITGVPLNTYAEEATDGNPRIDGGLTPTDGGPVTWQ
ncbi:hypothetical protein [Streptomyces bauhiniae]